MKCEICGKSYVQLAVHLRLKHKVDPYDYRMEYNIPLQVALADRDLVDHLSKKAKLRLLTDEGVDHLHRILENSRGVERVYKERPPASVEHCHLNNKSKELSFRELKLPKVLKAWLAGDSMYAIGKKYGVSHLVIKKWCAAGYLPERPQEPAVQCGGQ